jgi:Ca2+-binding EF-hand superfamily protein
MNIGKLLDMEASMGPKKNSSSGGMTPEMKKKFSMIDDFMSRNSMTVGQLHSKLDTDGDGQVTQEEFLQNITNLGINMTMDDFKKMFMMIDVNKNGSISVNEFGLFVNGAKLDKEKRINSISETTKRFIRQQINDMFNGLTNGSGNLNE